MKSNNSIYDLSESEINYLLSDSKSEEDYLNKYCWLIDKGLKRGLNKYKLQGYYEKHHILPRCMQGEDSDYNYVLLTALEHIIAHILLYKLYPDNINLLYSIQILVWSGKSNLQDNILSINRNNARIKIPNILKIVSSFREDHKKELIKPVVCYDIKTNDVIRVYENGVISTKDDGFSYKNIGTVLSKKKRKTVGGYGWSELREFEINHKDKLEEYYDNLSNGIVPEIGDIKENIKDTIRYLNKGKGKSIVCYDSEGNVKKIYNSITETISDGFSNVILSKILNNNDVSNFHRGYYWELYDEFLLKYPEKLNNEINILEVHSIIKDNRIICCDENYNIIKIYEELKDVNNDGFCNTTLCSVLSSKKRFFRGYYWYKTTDWIYKDKIEEYYSSRNPMPPVPKSTKNDPIKIINCTIDGVILGIYDNMHEADRITGISYKNISHAVNSKSHKYKDSYWYRVEDYNNKFNN